MQSGPTWLGIGAQRSGTTWLTDLLIQHPAVGLGTNGKKEQQALHRISRGVIDENEYTELFPRDELLRGDFTPRYLNSAFAPAVAARILPPDAPIIVILRDPVERFASALRKRVKQRRGHWPYEAAVAYAQWAGMYAPQLALWESTFSHDQLLVFTYEEVRADPAAACARIWRQFGLEPVALSDTGEPSSSSAGDASWTWPEGLRPALTTLYSTQLEELAGRWGVRTDLWSSFADASAAPAPA